MSMRVLTFFQTMSCEALILAASQLGGKSIHQGLQLVAF